MIKKEIFLVIIFFLSFSLLNSLMMVSSYPSRVQSSITDIIEYNLVIEGNHTFGGIISDRGYAIIQTADGGFAIAGYSESFSFNEKDFWLVRTDASGAILWNKTYGGAEDDEAYSIVSTSDGGFALTGYTKSFGGGFSDIWLVKTDSKGNMEWNETYGDNGNQGANVIIYTSDEGYLLVGTTRPSVANTDTNMWLVKTDASGIAVWNETYGGEEDDIVLSAIPTSDGGFALAGYTKSFGASNEDVWLVKTNTNGEVVWNETYGGAGFDQAFELIQTLDGGYALTGLTSSYGAGSADMWLLKTNGEGAIQWNQSYGNSEFDAGFSLLQTPDTGFAIAGTFDSGTGAGKMWFIKTDASGDIQFNATFRASYQTFGYSMIQINDGTYVLLGLITGWNEYHQLDEDLQIIIFNLESENGSTSAFSTASSSSATSSMSPLSTLADQTTTSTIALTTSGLTFSTFWMAVVIFCRRKNRDK